MLMWCMFSSVFFYIFIIIIIIITRGMYMYGQSCLCTRVRQSPVCMCVCDHKYTDPHMAATANRLYISNYYDLLC